MAARLFRGAASAVLFAAAALVSGCGGGDEVKAVRLAGDWSGSLTINYEGGGGVGGGFQMSLDQAGDFVAGLADWDPIGSTQSVAGPIDGVAVTLYLHFRCDGDPEAAALTGTFDGSALTVTGASGSACTDGGVASLVSGASGSLTRTSDDEPL